MPLAKLHFPFVRVMHGRNFVPRRVIYLTVKFESVCNDTHSLTHSLQWLKDVNQKVVLDNEESVPVLLLANKVSGHGWENAHVCEGACSLSLSHTHQCDLSENRQVEDSVLDEFCTEHNIIGWYVPSC